MSTFKATVFKLCILRGVRYNTAWGTVQIQQKSEDTTNTNTHFKWALLLANLKCGFQVRSSVSQNALRFTDAVFVFLKTVSLTLLTEIPVSTANKVTTK